MRTARSFWQSRMLLTAVELGVFSALGDGARTGAQVARRLRTDKRATERLMSALCAEGFLLKRRGGFGNTPETARFLVRGKPAYLGMLMHLENLWASWSSLTGAVRKGKSVYKRPGGKKLAARTRAFIGAMHARGKLEAGGLPRRLDLKGVSRVLDVGGGSGVFSMTLARAKNGLSSVVFDLPNVAPMTRAYVKAEGLSARVKAVPGDYNRGGFGGGYDLVLVSAILHANSPKQNRRLLKRCAAALRPGGRIAILEFVMNADRVSPPFGATFALNMLVNTKGGDTYTEREIRSWLGSAGFRRIKRTRTSFNPDLITATKR